MEASVKGRYLALVCIDQDDFKRVNDSLGRRSGDALLIEGAQRLMKLAGAGYLVARTGRDEFVVVVEDADANGAAERLSTRVHETLDDLVILRSGTTLCMLASAWHTMN